MSIHIANERLINGLLKGFHGSIAPDKLRILLSQDVEIVAPLERATFNDLWPAIWALAAVLERQLYGRVFIRCGLSGPLAAPSPLGSRCQFVSVPQHVSLSLCIGINTSAHDAIVGDACQQAIAVGSVFGDDRDPPKSIECFVLAGYLGFAAIARFVDIPEHKADFATATLKLPFDARQLDRTLKALEGVTCVGLGQLGQAYLALLFFLYGGRLSGRRLAVIDDDIFEKENGHTQLLLSDRGDWRGKHKVPYIASVVSQWDADVFPVPEKIGWTWRRGSAHPALALLGLHDLEGRRMACAAGFERLIESGVGTDLLKPRVSWHSLPGDRLIGQRLFPEAFQVETKADEIDTAWAGDLKNTPGGCGWVEFKGISATAPCLGVAAVAFALSELGRTAEVISGSALLWSQCIPSYRETFD